MSLGLYIFNAAGEPVEEPDTLKWAEWMEGAQRTVAYDQIDEYDISTIFLGLDFGHARIFKQPGAPVLWETMIFWRRDAQHEWQTQQMQKPIDEWESFPEQDPYDLDREGFRYRSLDDAKAGHERAVKMVRRRHFRVSEQEW